MPDSVIKSLLTKIKTAAAAYPWHNRWQQLKAKSVSFLTSWWKLLLGALAALVFLYYPLGGWLVNNIDTTTDYEINTPTNQSATVEMMSFLIKREVSDKLWTPNLPIIFPSYFLDNMPNFQLGELSAISQTATSLSKRLDKTIAPKAELPLKTATELLNYPGTIWLFSPTNKLSPAPSSNSQYRRARRHLMAYNQGLRNENVPFYKSASDLSYFVERMTTDLWNSNKQLETQIREHSMSMIDGRADNVFYYQKGKLYAYHLLFKALCTDYKDVIVAGDLYPSWIKLLKALEEGAQISPTIVRNGEIGSTFAPNHLAEIGFYTLKAATVGHNIVYKMEKNAQQEAKSK